MDRKYGPQWHCAIGEGFGFDVTYQQPNMIYVYYGIGILLFKCCVHKGVVDCCGWGARRPRSRLDRSSGALGATRTTWAWPSSTRGFLGFTCRPRRRRRRMRLLLVVVARVPSRVVRASRPLLRRAGARSSFRCVPSWFFCLSAGGVFVRVLTILVFGHLKSCPCPAVLALLVARRSWRPGRCRCLARTRAKLTAISPARHRSRNRCTHAAQELRTRRGKSDATQQWMRQENRCPSSPSAD